MDEIAKLSDDDLLAVRSVFGTRSDPEPIARKKRERRGSEKAATPRAMYETGRDAQINFRVTPELRDRVLARVAERRKRKADCFEEMFAAWEATLGK